MYYPKCFDHQQQHSCKIALPIMRSVRQPSRSTGILNRTNFAVSCQDASREIQVHGCGLDSSCTASFSSLFSHFTSNLPLNAIIQHHFPLNSPQLQRPSKTMPGPNTLCSRCCEINLTGLDSSHGFQIASSEAELEAGAEQCPLCEGMYAAYTGSGMTGPPLLRLKSIPGSERKQIYICATSNSLSTFPVRRAHLVAVRG